MENNNVQVLSDGSLLSSGFSQDEIQAATEKQDGFVGEKNGVKYYRAQNEYDINLGDHKTREVRLPGQQGEM